MKILLANGNIVTGDGKTVINRASVVIEDWYISQVTNVPYQYGNDIGAVIDAEDGYIIPGVINHHVHGVAFGPSSPSGGIPKPYERVIRNLNKLMLEGTTTVLSSCGFATMEEVEAANKLHPINIKTGTTHTPLNLRTAELADGKGLQERHKKLTVEEQLRLGAVAIAEVGGGDVLGGGATDYMVIPNAVKKKTGILLTNKQARSLKEAILGRHISPKAFDSVRTGQVLKEIGLDKHLSIDECRKLVTDAVVPSYEMGIRAFEEAAELAEKFDVPMEVHNAVASMDAVYKVAQRLGNRLIAGHSNHASFKLNECLEQARRIKKCGSIVDISTLDPFGAKQIAASPEYLEMTFAMMKEGLVDIISTDYAGGLWDSELLLLDAAVREGAVDLPTAIAMATGNVTKVFPKLAPNRGLIEPGRVADVVVVNRDNIGKVKTVIIAGTVTVEDGKIKTPVR